MADRAPFFIPSNCSWCIPNHQVLPNRVLLAYSVRLGHADFNTYLGEILNRAPFAYMPEKESMYEKIHAVMFFAMPISGDKERFEFA